MSDLLERATASLRAAGTADEAEAASATRARIMASFHQRARRRTTALTFFIPIAAVLVGSVAWGASRGQILPVWRALVSVVTGHTPPRARNPPAPPLPAADSADPFPPRSAESELVAPRIDRPAARPVQPRAAHPPRRHAAVDSPPAPPPVSGADRLYRAAHQAHFMDRDPARALDAWNDYLAAFPGGPLALEARYNRALCLVRLGRIAEAREALAPFARGEYGSYRRDEAEALLEALGDH